MSGRGGVDAVALRRRSGRGTVEALLERGCPTWSRSAMLDAMTDSASETPRALPEGGGDHGRGETRRGRPRGRAGGARRTLGKTGSVGRLNTTGSEWTHHRGCLPRRAFDSGQARV